MKSKTIEVYDWFDIQAEICKEMNIDESQFRDFKDSGCHFYKWCDSKGYGNKDPEGKSRGSSQIWFKEYNQSPEGEASRPEYIDFWHLAINKSVIPDEMHNDSIVTMFAIEDYEEDKESYTDGVDWKELFFNAYQKVMLKIDPNYEGVSVSFSW